MKNLAFIKTYLYNITIKLKEGMYMKFSKELEEQMDRELAQYEQDWLIFYEINDDGVEISKIFSSKQDFNSQNLF